MYILIIFESLLISSIAYVFCHFSTTLNKSSVLQPVILDFMNLNKLSTKEKKTVFELYKLTSWCLR